MFITHWLCVSTSSYDPFTGMYLVQHVYREGNCLADALARWGCLMDDTFVVFNHLPSTDILCLINSDLAGNCNVRTIRTVSNGLTSSVG